MGAIIFLFGYYFRWILEFCSNCIYFFLRKIKSISE